MANKFMIGDVLQIISVGTLDWEGVDWLTMAGFKVGDFVTVIYLTSLSISVKEDTSRCLYYYEHFNYPSSNLRYKSKPCSCKAGCKKCGNTGILEYIVAENDNR